MAKLCWSHEPVQIQELWAGEKKRLDRICSELAVEKERLIWEELKNANKDAFYREPALVPK